MVANNDAMDDEESMHGETLLSKQQQHQQQNLSEEIPTDASSSSFGGVGVGGSSSSLRDNDNDDDDDDDEADSDVYDDDDDDDNHGEEVLLFSLEQDVRVSEDIASRHYRTVVESETSKRQGSLHARSCFTTTADDTTEQQQQQQEQQESQTCNKKKQKYSTSSSSKRVSFAADPANTKYVRCLIHNYEQSATNMDELWFSRSEINEIHANVKAFAANYQANNPKYIAAVLGLSFSFKKNVTKKHRQRFRTVLEEGSNNGDHDGGTRGLEPVIVEISKTFREAHIDMVLTCQRQMQQQQQQQQDGLSTSKKLIVLDHEALRRASRKTSQPSRQLARKLGVHDTFQAIKATLMPWNKASTTAPGGAAGEEEP